MPTLVGVKLRFAPKVLYFDPAGTDLAPGDAVVVETERGIELGQVVDLPCEVAESEMPDPVKSIARVATETDIAVSTELQEREREGMRVFRELIEKHGLEMKAVDVEYLFGGDKAIFYFVSEERVDFRELVRELASRFHTRIDMRQVGVRDEARMVGGLGHCGQQLCCVRFTGDFQPVSIRMAKEQDLPLNPLKISGLCGRLMCCLRYEYEAYKDFKSRAPKRGAKIETPLGEGKITGFNTPRETVGIRLAEGGSINIALDAVECPGGGRPCKVRAEAMEASASLLDGAALVASTTESKEPKPDTGRDKGQQDKASGDGKSSRARRKSRRQQSGGGEAKQRRQKKAAESPPEAKAAAGTGSSEGQKPKEGRSTGRRRRRRRSSPPRDGDKAKG